MRAILLKTQKLLLLTSLAYWGVPSLPLVPTLESSQKGALVTYGDEGQERWKAEWTLEPFALDGQPMVRSSTDSPFTLHLPKESSKPVAVRRRPQKD